MRFTGRPSSIPVPQTILVRSSVALTGAAVVAAASLGGLDLWSATCAGTAVVLLAASTTLLMRWADGPSAFLIAATLQSATAPHPTTAQHVAMVVFITGYLLIVDAAQPGRGSIDPRLWRPHLHPYVIGAVLGVTLAVVSAAPLAGSPWTCGVAAIIAGTAGAGLLALTASGDEPRRGSHDMPPG